MAAITLLCQISVSAQSAETIMRGVLDNRVDLVKEGIAMGGDTDQRVDGKPLLVIAAERGNPVIVRLMIEAGTDQNQKTDSGITALVAAKTALKKAKPSQVANYRKIVTLLGGKDEDPVRGRQIGVVFSGEGAKIVITGAGISAAKKGKALIVATAQGNVRATVSEVLHTQIKAVAEKPAAKGSAVYLAE